MFEIGFSEILLIVVIALVVVGPQKLPRLASQVGRWVGRARNMARQFREQLESEVDLEKATSWAENKKPSASASSTAGAAAGAAGVAAADATADTTSTPPPEPAPVYPYTDHQPDTTDDTYSHAHAAGGLMQDASPAYSPEPPPMYSDTAPAYAPPAEASAVPNGEQVDWVSAQHGGTPQPVPVPATDSRSSQHFVADTHEGLHEDHHAQR